MAGIGGHFLKSFGAGLLDMSMQQREMNWKDKQQKKLDDKQKKLEDAAMNYKGLLAQYGEDNEFTNEEISQLNTAFMAMGYDAQQLVKDSHKHIQNIETGKVDEDMVMLDTWIKWTENQTPENIAESYEEVKGWVQSEKGKRMFEVEYNLSQKKQSITNEVFQSPADVLKAYPEAGYQYSASAKGYVPTFQKDTTTPPTEMDTMDKNKKILDFAYNTGNAERFNQVAKNLGVQTTFETYKQGYEKPEKAGTTETVTTLKNWEKMFDIRAEEGPKTEEEYNRALNLLGQSEDNYKPKYASWKEALVVEVKGIAKDLEGITDKEDFNFLLNIYMQKLEEIKAKYPEVNLDQFTVFEEKKGWFDKLKEKVGL